MRVKIMEMTRIRLRRIVLLALLAWLLPSGARAQVPCTPMIGATAFSTLQQAVDAAVPGDTINVTGTCTESVFVGEEKEGITLDGDPGNVGAKADIVSEDTSSQAILVRGRGITIRDFKISSGQNGILVQRGGTVRIDRNVITLNGRGINVNQHSFAILIRNVVNFNESGGVLINENSSARIGFEFGTQSTSCAEPNPNENDISSNGTEAIAGRGILVSRSSTARIAGNIINGNSDDGVAVVRSSQADISCNQISLNQGDGIFVSQNSVANLGVDSGTDIFDEPNRATANNAGAGVRCRQNSVVDGRLGTLFGDGGATDFTGSCTNSLILPVP